MTDIVTAASALLILSGAAAPAPVPRPILAITPAIAQAVYCQFDMLPQPNPNHGGNHLTVRWVDRPRPPLPHPGGGCGRGCGHEEGRPGHHPQPPRHRHHRHDPGLIE